MLLFRALVAARSQVTGLAMGWKASDTAAVSAALATGKWALLPGKLRELLEQMASEIERAST